MKTLINIEEVRKLATSIHELQLDYEHELEVNATLRAEIERLKPYVEKVSELTKRIETYEDSEEFKTKIRIQTESELKELGSKMIEVQKRLDNLKRT